MKKKLISFSCAVIAVLALCSMATGQNVSVSTDITGWQIKPVKAGGSRSFKVEVTNPSEGSFTFSINRDLSFPGFKDWVSVDNSQITLPKDAKGTFTVTIAIPANVPEYELTFYVNLNKLNGSTWGHCYTHQLPTKLLIDNTSPVISTVNTMNITSTSAKLAWSSSDSRSAVYTSTNTTTGFEGIETYSAILRDQSGSVYSWSEKATIYNQSHTFDNLKSNTEYTPIVSVTDMAGNVASFTGVKFITPPAAPTNLAATGTDYCSTTLIWNASAGATRYHVYNATKSPATEIGTTSGTSYRVAGLSAGAQSKYYVTAESAAGFSPTSSVLSVTTLSVPTPIITGSASVCNSIATYTVTNLPLGCTVLWSSSSILSLTSASGNTATFSFKEFGAGAVTATFISCGGKGNPFSKSVQYGIPEITFVKFTNAVGEEGYWCSSHNDNNYTISTSFGDPSYEIQLLEYPRLNVVATYSGMGGGGSLGSPTPGYYVFKVRVVSNCGYGDWFETEVESRDCSGGGEPGVYSPRPNVMDINSVGAILSPNPANTIVAVNIANPNVDGGDFFSTVRIYNTLGQLVKDVMVEGCESSFSVADLSEGMYVVHVVSGDATYKQKLQIVR